MEARRSAADTKLHEALARAVRAVAKEAAARAFGEPVAYVYNPLDYAWEAHRLYLRRFARRGVRALLLGMNPGPFGMAQTGVPFGEVAAVRDWMGIRARIGRPGRAHPKRPVQGFDCPRSEVSGRRLYGWARDRFGPPERFFERFFVHNYCPLAFLEESGRNLTPDKLPKAEREDLLRICDRGLRKVVALLRPDLVIGIGTFAERRAREALADGLDGPLPGFGRILHPSPASPAANRGWAAQAERQLEALDCL